MARLYNDRFGCTPLLRLGRNKHSHDNKALHSEAQAAAGSRINPQKGVTAPNKSHESPPPASWPNKGVERSCCLLVKSPTRKKPHLSS